jgi:general secretion pathway protein G
VAIVGLLAALATPLAELAVKRAREQDLRVALRQIRTGIDAYKQAATDKRIEAAQDSSGYPPDLDTLVKGVEDITTPARKKIYFLRRLPRDPMFPDPTVPAAESWGLRSYASPPDDPRPGEDVYDVYSLAEGVGINGVPYRAW